MLVDHVREVCNRVMTVGLLSIIFSCLFIRTVRGASAAEYEATLKKVYTVNTVQVHHNFCKLTNTFIQCKCIANDLEISFPVWVTLAEGHSVSRNWNLLGSVSGTLHSYQAELVWLYKVNILIYYTQTKMLRSLALKSMLKFLVAHKTIKIMMMFCFYSTSLWRVSCTYWNITRNKLPNQNASFHYTKWWLICSVSLARGQGVGGGGGKGVGRGGGRGGDEIKKYTENKLWNCCPKWLLKHEKQMQPCKGQPGC